MAYNLISFQVIIITFAMVFVCSSSDQLSHNFYKDSCPEIFKIVQDVVQAEIKKETRMGASLLRLHFHDCFVNGCDGSVLLDDRGSSLKSEKSAGANKNSLRGFDVVDKIKAALEDQCPGVVSCADILALAAVKSVQILGQWSGYNVKLGRRDSKTANKTLAESGAIPSPASNLTQLINIFKTNNLNIQDLVALSGGHTIGLARCSVIRNRIYNDTDIDKQFAKDAQKQCRVYPKLVDDNNLQALDISSQNSFDNGYFKDVISKKTLLHSDQQLLIDPLTIRWVTKYSAHQHDFLNDFGNSMLKMGDINVLMGKNGQIRKNCRRVN